MEIQSNSMGEMEEDEPMDGSLPPSLTHDPTQGTGSRAWQLSLQHNLRVNARQRRN